MSKYIIVLHKQVEKFLDAHKDVAKRAYPLFSKLATDPTSPDIDTKPLQGLENCYRLRIGKYRFLYRVFIDKVMIYFYDAGSR